MELSKLRETGELSDIRVQVSGEEYNLHQFPLFIKSAYFKELAEAGTGHSGENKIELDDFPGGKQAFETVADFCYNKRVDITLDNVVILRCAAEFMQMHGSGNLIELTDRYLNDILTSARLSRSLVPVIDLLGQCSELGEIAEKAEVADKCFSAVVDIWMKPSSMFSTPRKSQLYGDDALITDKFVQLSLDWFIKLINAFKTNETKLKPLADLVCNYLKRVFQCEAAQKDDAPNDESHQENGEDGESVEKEDEEIAGSDAEADEKELAAIESARSGQQELPKLKESAGKILDSVINELPENTPLAEVISVDWIRRAIEVSEKYDCNCRERLLQLAGNILHRFTNEELKEIPSSVLCDIIENTIRNEKIVPEVLTCVLDNYLHDLARKGNLNVDDFIKLVKSVPDDYRSSHDTLFEVMEQLLSSGEDIPDDKKRELLEAVDLSRCNEKTLQRALDKNVVPVKEVCQAAINLATRLRTDSEQQQFKPKKIPSNPEPNIRYDRNYAAAPLPTSNSTPYGYGAPSAPMDPIDYPTGLSYSSSYTPSYPLRSRTRPDDYSAALEDNLRSELNRISSSYDHYFRDHSVRHPRDRDAITNRYSGYKGSTRRW